MEHKCEKHNILLTSIRTDDKQNCVVCEGCMAEHIKEYHED